MLRQLKDAGNCVAQEYCHHVDAIEAAMAEHISITSGNTGALGVMSTAGFEQAIPPLSEPVSHGLAAAAGMPWTEPSLQNLLAQSALDLQFLETTAQDHYSSDLLWSSNGGQ